MKDGSEEDERKETTPFEGFFFLREDDERLQKGLLFACYNVHLYFFTTLIQSVSQK